MAHLTLLYNRSVLEFALKIQFTEFAQKVDYRYRLYIDSDYIHQL